MVKHDGHMSAPTPTLKVEADEPEIWSITGVDARTVEVRLWDTNPKIFVIFRFGMVPGRPLAVLSYTVYSDYGIEQSLRDLPVTRWEKAARAAAERRLVGGGPYGQRVDREQLAQWIVDEKFPELIEATRGNALRRRNGLLQLAQRAAEYMEAKESGSSNPAEALAERHGVSSATVRGWLYRARREGLALESSHPNASPRPQP